MTKPTAVLKFEAVPGDLPQGIEQLDGDLLLPAAARPLIEQALLLAEQAVPADQRDEHTALAMAKRLLGIKEVDQAQVALQANLVKLRPL